MELCDKSVEIQWQPHIEYKGSEMNLFQASDEVQTKVPRLNPSSGRSQAEVLSSN